MQGDLHGKEKKLPWLGEYWLLAGGLAGVVGSSRWRLVVLLLVVARCGCWRREKERWWSWWYRKIVGEGCFSFFCFSFVMGKRCFVFVEGDGLWHELVLFYPFGFS